MTDEQLRAFRAIHGQCSGALVHIEEASVRLSSLLSVLGDISEGLVQIEGFAPATAMLVASHVDEEIDALSMIRSHIGAVASLIRALRETLQ